MITAMGVAAVCFTVTARLPNLETVIQIESGGDPAAVSSAGARGLCQIMPATWDEFARPGERWDNPDNSRAVARRYLIWIQRTLKLWGDPNWNHPHHILAAYNGGIGRFHRCGFNIDRMPRETRDYVRHYRQLMARPRRTATQPAP